MEFPNVGKHCALKTCNRLDFLPITCDACQQDFCIDHYSYSVHNCANAYSKDIQVPTCPLCNQPISLPRGSSPDAAVNMHIMYDCKGTAKVPKKVHPNKCSVKGCKDKELVEIRCKECCNIYCLRHRYVAAHNCEGSVAAQRKKILDATLLRQTVPNTNANFAEVQGSMSEDEALARALALSMQDSNSYNTNGLSQEELDHMVARDLQLAQTARNRRSNQERCSIS